MKLYIDGHSIQPCPGQSLLELVKQLDLEGNGLKDRPLAAKLAGEVFTLNYIPVREKDACNDRPSIRRAMASSDGVIQLLRLTDPAGRDVYDRTAQFVILLALHQLCPKAKAKMGCTVVPELFV